MHGTYMNNWWAKIVREISELSNADGRLPGEPLASTTNATVDWHVPGVWSCVIWKYYNAYLMMLDIQINRLGPVQSHGIKQW